MHTNVVYRDNMPSRLTEGSLIHFHEILPFCGHGREQETDSVVLRSCAVKARRYERMRERGMSVLITTAPVDLVGIAANHATARNKGSNDYDEDSAIKTTHHFWEAISLYGSA